MKSFCAALLPVFVLIAAITPDLIYAQPAGFAVMQRGADWRVLGKTTVEHGTNRIHQYTELATGLNYQNSYGQWTESQEQITLLPSGGAAATQGRHKVYFPADIYNGVLEVVTPDGKHLKSRPLGLAYDDGSNTVFIAELKHAQGYLTSSNTVTYRDAFTGFKADLVCQYRRGGFECDLVFRQQPPTPGDYGLDESFSTLQMITEFFNTADPEQVRAGYDDWFGLQDNTLKFGKLTMTHGKAFAFKGTNAQPSTINSQPASVAVYKSWVHLEGRTFLIESVPVLDIADNLNALPLTASVQKPEAGSLLAVLRFPSSARQFPLAHKIITGTNQMLLATAAFNKEPGVVLDYTAFDSDQTDFTFQASQTYYIPSDIYFSGNVTIEGGAIIKSSGYLVLWDGLLICPDSPENPAVFTSLNDNSIGETISGSSGQPQATDYGAGLYVPDSATLADCRNFIFRYAGTGIASYRQLPIISNCQFIDCDFAVALAFSEGGAITQALQNVLMARCHTGVLSFNEVALEGEQLTVDQCGVFLDAPYGSLAGITNSLFTAVTNLGGAQLHDSPQLSSSTGVYQTAASANYYLATSSPYRDVGTTNINPDLLAELQTMTTYAPQDGGCPDTNAPDLGYHYPVNEDSDHDGLPDWWEWKYFGNYNQQGKLHFYFDDGDWFADTLGDYDGDGISNLQSYQNGTDPNTIRFSIESTNDYVNHTNVSVQLNIVGGVPSYYAVVVNSGATNWLPFVSTNIAANIGSTDGTYNVIVGLKGRPADAVETWQDYEFFLDRVPPKMIITNPVLASASSTVIKPYLQLQGLADEPLASLSYDVSNATGLFSNQDLFVHGQTFNTNVFDYTTNYFHACDVPLATNVNVFTVRVTDRAGNVTTTNFNVVLDYAGATNPPVVKLVWPTNGMAVSATNCTMRGTMSDETGSIVAIVVNGDGTTNLITGIVERNGVFWLENVPLNGTNQISIQATDAAGNVAVTNFTVKPSAIQFKIVFTPTGEDLYKPFGMVGGTVSDPTATVSVNGAAANVDATANSDGTYTWIVNDAPIDGTGTATFDAFAANDSGGGSSSGGGGGPANNASVEAPYMIQITHHSSGRSYHNTFFTPDSADTSQGTATTTYTASYSGGYNSYSGHFDTIDSSSGSGGSYSGENHYFWAPFFASRSWSNSDGNDGSTSWGPSLPSPLFGDQFGGIWGVPGRDLSVQGWLGTSGGYNGYPPTWVMHYYAKGVKHNWHFDYGGGNGSDMEVTAGAMTTMTLYTGGKSGSVKKHLFRVQGSAGEYGKSKEGGWGNTPVKSVPKKSIYMLGKYADQFGEVVKSLPDNEEVNLGLWCPGIKHYNAGATIVSRECNPQFLQFVDVPRTGYISWPRQFRATLKAVCNHDWDKTNYETLASMSWGFNIDISGQVTFSPTNNNGARGECNKIVILSTDSTPGSFSSPAAPEINAYFVGCCNGDLNWIQTIDEDTASSRVPPYEDGNTNNSYFPFVYGPNGCNGLKGVPDWRFEIRNNTKDYPANFGWPTNCPP